MTIELQADQERLLRHAVEYLTGNNVTESEYKKAILDVLHAVELLLKESLKRNHPVKPISRIADLNDTDRVIPKGFRHTVVRSRDIRNKIECADFHVSASESEAILGNLLAFMFHYGKAYP